ncbi:hypothetical protein [Allostreptomyces psammosilenae]|uniref:Uncharacterized protein n=1 Tax=Allostreptomyces psammosilenae TaxID=1892865 RepID=A0A852ZUY9_9ACTN|nr:hypothetical protein [Allostreptomyces psammosilenae]NYI05090.1 hypothetical protein [Allostreptomyces psammosilenae]
MTTPLTPAIPEPPVPTLPERADALEECLGELTRARGYAAARRPLRRWRALAPSPAELRPHLPVLLVLLAEAPSTAAAVAQRALHALDEAGALGPRQRRAVTVTALRRPEQRLILAELRALERAAPGPGTEPLLAAVAEATRHAAPAVRAAASRVLARLAGQGGGALPGPVGPGPAEPEPSAARAAGVQAGVAGVAGDATSGATTTGRPLPVGVVPTALPESLGALLGGRRDPVLLAGALQALGDHVEREGRESLRTLLAGMGRMPRRGAPVSHASPVSQASSAPPGAGSAEGVPGAGDAPASVREGLERLVAAGLGAVPQEGPDAGASGSLRHGDGDGAGAGARPPVARALLEHLGALERWLRGPADAPRPRLTGPADLPTPPEPPAPPAPHGGAEVAEVAEVAEHAPVGEEAGAAPGEPQRRRRTAAPPLDWWAWPVVLPDDREALAAHALAAGLDRLPHGDAGTPSGAAELLPWLVAGDGPCGPAVDRALLCGLAARDPLDRIAATDALVHLARAAGAGADGWDPEAFGDRLGRAAAAGVVPTTRLAGSLHAAAGAAHAAGAVWRALRAALPHLLAGRGEGGGGRRRGTDALLNAAVVAASAAGARGSFPALDAVAGLSRPVPAVLSARTLREVLEPAVGG